MRRTVLLKRFQAAGLLSAAAWTLLAASAASAAQVTVYQNATAFVSALEPDYYLENFDTAPIGQQFQIDSNGNPVVDANGNNISIPMDFNANGYQYSVDVPGDFIYITNDPNNTVNQALSTYGTGFNIVFTFGIGSGISAVGGNFFPTDASGGFSSGTFTVTLADGTQQTLTDPAGTDFLGFVSDSEIVSLTVNPTACPPPNDDGALNPCYATVDNFYAGSVPEPQSVFLLLGGLTAVVLLHRRNIHRKA